MILYGLVIWIGPDERIDVVGNVVSSFMEVSHCYYRARFEGWQYNLYAMVHAKSAQEFELIIAKISRKAGIADYRILFSKREFKKSSMKYLYTAKASEKC